MLRHEGAEMGQDMEAGKCDGGGHPEQARQAGRGAAGGNFGFIRRFDRTPGMVVVGLAGFGRRQAARRADQKAHLQVFFQVGDCLGDGRLADIQDARSAGKRARVNDGNKRPHCAQTVHLLSPVKCEGS